jgi:hypothetical protein
MADNITTLYPELPRERVDQIVFDMDEVVHEALYLSEILADVLGYKLSDASPGARAYLAILLEEKTRRIRDEWQRAFDATHLASKAAE